MEQTFTINLISNASMQVFPANTLAQFTTLLPHRIELAGDWEVAILEVSWPAKVKNITSAAFTLSCFAKSQRDQQDRNIMERYQTAIIQTSTF